MERRRAWTLEVEGCLLKGGESSGFGHLEVSRTHLLSCKSPKLCMIVMHDTRAYMVDSIYGSYHCLMLLILLNALVCLVLIAMLCDRTPSYACDRGKRGIPCLIMKSIYVCCFRGGSNELYICKDL